ncbi:Type IV pilus biogenesis protein PilO [Microcystis panniformis FACHB-1757]|uniref:Type IV pilus biogenesis protein PilO n=1 Tax=Microcystis panniformis FACHB-1757 TaxID=1638788 RepID=A0A0K1RTP3_9CHRO|nr:Type IV pilus biogenesis protein PilO [Microcystis panniformis FACHB-1757]
MIIPLNAEELAKLAPPPPPKVNPRRRSTPASPRHNSFQSGVSV